MKLIRVMFSGLIESLLHTMPFVMFAFAGYIMNDIKGETNLWAMTLFTAACVFVVLGLFLILMVGVQYVDYMEMRKEKDVAFKKRHKKCFSPIIVEVENVVCDCK